MWRRKVVQVRQPASGTRVEIGGQSRTSSGLTLAFKVRQGGERLVSSVSGLGTVGGVATLSPVCDTGDQARSFQGSGQSAIVIATSNNAVAPAGWAPSPQSWNVHLELFYLRKKLSTLTLILTDPGSVGTCLSGPLARAHLLPHLT